MKYQLVFPFALYVFLIWFSTVYMFLKRVKSIRAGETSRKYFKALMGDLPPEKVVVVGRHYDNQFQLPMLFFITCVLHIQIGMVNLVTVILAWAFIASRVAHSFILLGSNVLSKRVAAFAFGWLLVLLLWIQILYFVLLN